MAADEWAPDDDFFGTERPWGRRADIGAFEYDGQFPRGSED